MDQMSALAAEAAATLPAPGEDTLHKLQRLGSEVLQIDQELAALEEKQKAHSERRQTILAKEMVEIMDVARVERIQVQGQEFVATDYFKASIPVESPTAAEAYNWLEARGEGDLIKYQVVTTFSKDSETDARTLEEYIRKKYGRRADVVRVRTVPWARLTSWLKAEWGRRVGAGEPALKPDEMELLGATVGRVVKLPKPKD